MMHSSGDNGDSEDDDDGMLWNSVTQDVTPLKDREPCFSVKKQKKIFKNKDQISPEKEENISKIPLSGLAVGRDIDKNLMNRLKEGRLALEGRIDLHGMTQEKARIILTEFISGSYAQQKRCLLVITGKGEGKNNGKQDQGDWWEVKKGILRQRVPQWLDQPPLCGIVLQYHIARPRHGGEGAFYVLLRRQRS
ncbi:MAG: DNA mismatch repair protein MutS [Alphaproteobacteria bacterium CG_4_9_14_3_um_filter_47_13]|nr:MAG: DNA mismatch repair protein MutS [Alphaproteobacteria bacterium CG_4_9_14_3_um_filter_47_13]